MCIFYVLLFLLSARLSIVVLVLPSFLLASRVVQFVTITAVITMNHNATIVASFAVTTIISRLLRETLLLVCR